MNFSDLTFVDHAFPGGTVAVHTFPNRWAISVVAGPKGCGIHGTIGEDTFEVAIINPNSVMLDDPLAWQTPVQITTIMRVVSML
jgi:hypothetical protein